MQSTRDEALALKQRGNELYKQNKFEEAIRCYEQAIQVCPQAHKDQLSVFHQNLAAVYDAMVRQCSHLPLEGFCAQPPQH